MSMDRRAFVEAACRAYWGRTWDQMPEKEKLNHRAGVLRLMEFMKKNGWAQPTQVLGAQLAEAASVARLAKVKDRVRALHAEASTPLPDDF